MGYFFGKKNNGKNIIIIFQSLNTDILFSFLTWPQPICFFFFFLHPLLTPLPMPFSLSFLSKMTVWFAFGEEFTTLLIDW